MGVTRAVILAAGMGTRLKSLGQQAPKGLLAMEGEPIIEGSIRRLRRAGIDRITIVTGYRSESYQALAARYPELVDTVHNPHYADSGSMYSLYMARECLMEDFLLLESDLIYEQRALDTLLDSAQPNLLLLSGATGAGDEVYVEAKDGCLSAMSKDQGELNGEVAGELVGITRVSRDLFAGMCGYASTCFERTRHVDYETDALVAAGKSVPVHCIKVTDLLWSEIDDETHYRRALEIYPRILCRDK
jgi:2-aminoethylphosphonate-pyruvate transaminase